MCGLIPSLIRIHILQPIVRTEIHDKLTGFDANGNRILRLGMWKSEKNRISAVCQGVRGQRFKPVIHDAFEAGEYGCHRLSRRFLRGHRGDREIRMSRSQTHQFRTGISTCSRNGDSKFLSHQSTSSRMLKKSSGGVLASLKGSTYRSVRLTCSLTAALLDGLFEHPHTPIA